MYASRHTELKERIIMAAATIKVVMDYFGRKPGQTLKDWTEEWKALSEESREQIKEGIGNGTLSY
jgi:hypothetical protein